MTPEERYEIFLEKYAKKHEISIKEARKHALCEVVKSYYEEDSDKNASNPM